MADEYMKSVWKRLVDYKRLNTTALSPVPADTGAAGTRQQTAKKEIKKSSSAPVRKKRGGFIHVMDKIGDIIIFPIVKMAELSDLGKSGKKKIPDRT